MPVDKNSLWGRFGLVVPRPLPLCHCFFVRGSLPRSVWPDSSPSFLSHGRVKGLVNLQSEELETTWLAVVLDIRIWLLSSTSKTRSPLILLKTKREGGNHYLSQMGRISIARDVSKGIPPVKVFTPSFTLVLIEFVSCVGGYLKEKGDERPFNCFAGKYLMEILQQCWIMPFER